MECQFQQPNKTISASRGESDSLVVSSPSRMESVKQSLDVGAEREEGMWIMSKGVGVPGVIWMASRALESRLYFHRRF